MYRWPGRRGSAKKRWNAALVLFSGRSILWWRYHTFDTLRAIGSVGRFQADQRREPSRAGAVYLCLEEISP